MFGNMVLEQIRMWTMINQLSLMILRNNSIPGFKGFIAIDSEHHALFDNISMQVLMMQLVRSY